MAKYYEISKNKYKKPQTNLFKQITLYLFIFISGYCSAAVLNIHDVFNWLSRQFFHQNDMIVIRKDDASSNAHKIIQPKFEFYTLLSKDNSPPVVAHPEMTTSTATVEPINPVRPVETPNKIAVQQSIMKPIAVINSSHTTNKYWVQIAAFTKRLDAEHLKAKLALKGYMTMVVVANKDNINWYRVISGPFHDQLAAKKMQNTLAHAEHLNGMIRKV